MQLQLRGFRLVKGNAMPYVVNKLFAALTEQFFFPRRRHHLKDRDALRIKPSNEVGPCVGVGA